MGLVRLLWNQLVFVATMVQDIAEILVSFLRDILGMTLPNIKDEKKKQNKKKKKENEARSAPKKKPSKEVQILKKTRFAYPDWVRVLEEHKELVGLLTIVGMDEQEASKV